MNTDKPQTETNTMLAAVNTAFNDSLFEIVLSDNNLTPGITVFETRLKPNDYCQESNVGAFKDAYFDKVKSVFQKMDKDVSFNNTGRIFWITG